MKKGKISVCTNDTSISMSKSIGLPHAITAGVTIGLLIGRLVYDAYRQGIGSGVQSILDSAAKECDCCESVEETTEQQ